MNWRAFNTMAWIGLCLSMGCSDCGNVEQENVQIRFVSDRTSLENELNQIFFFEVRLGSSSTQEVTVDYKTVELPNGAKVGEDFEAAEGTLVFAPGETSQTIPVNIIVDDQLEANESFEVHLSDPVNGFLKDGRQVALGTIVNDDTQFLIDLPEGYDTPITPSNPPQGMTLTWSDEFDGEDIDAANWVHELGGNGWGNQEAQTYTADEKNSYVEDGHLFIVAHEEGATGYSSARLKSENLQEFTHGRIDVRAVLPYGQALWPAIWMLGANFNDPGVGWPRCGEIDIMELKGQQPDRIHGTAHWGKIIGGGHPSSTGITFAELGTTFSDEFHVFSLEWTPDTMKWIVNDEVFRQFATNTTLEHPPYNDPNDDMFFGQNPFNLPFFFILNVAVGGTFVGGYPDESTVFPQYMAIDYVRVYQVE